MLSTKHKCKQYIYLPLGLCIHMIKGTIPKATFKYIQNKLQLNIQIKKFLSYKYVGEFDTHHYFHFNQSIQSVHIIAFKSPVCRKERRRNFDFLIRLILFKFLPIDIVSTIVTELKCALQ